MSIATIEPESETDDAEAVVSDGGERGRMCALTRAVRPEAELIRFVADPAGGVAPDLKRKLPGRGVWVSADRASVAAAVKRNVFRRALKREVTPAAGLPELVATLLRQAALGRLGLARKSGDAIAGFTKVEAAIGRERLAGLILAADAAEDGARKIRAALTRRFGEACAVPVIRAFDAEELGLALGRASVIHAAVLQSPSGRSFVEAAERLLRYESLSDGPSGFSAGDPRHELSRKTTGPQGNLNE